MLGDVCCYLMDYLQQEHTDRDLCLIFGISYEELNYYLRKLRNMGVVLKAKYYDNGEISYRVSKRVIDDDISKNVKLNFSDGKNSLKCVAISDLHYGNTLARTDLVDKVFDYCKKSGIHTIFCCGDFIDGTYTMGWQNISDVYSQIDYFIKNYPRSDDIVTFGVGGDHDYSAFYVQGQDVLKGISNYRSDIVLTDYNNVSVDVNSDKIFLHHKIKAFDKKYGGYASLFLKGHTHTYASRMIGSEFLELTVPSLSDICTTMPSFVEMQISFKSGYIKEILIKHLGYKDSDFVLLSENSFVLTDKNKSNNYGIIFDELRGNFNRVNSLRSDSKKKVKTRKKKKDRYEDRLR